MLEPARRANIPIGGQVRAEVDVTGEIVAGDLSSLGRRGAAVGRQPRLRMLAGVDARRIDVTADFVGFRIAGGDLIPFPAMLGADGDGDGVAEHAVDVPGEIQGVGPLVEVLVGQVEGGRARRPERRVQGVVAVELGAVAAVAGGEIPLPPRVLALGPRGDLVVGL